MAKHPDKKHQELNYHFHRLRYMMAVMVVIGCVIFTPSFIWLFEQSITIMNIPLILQYIFGVWLLLILCSLWIHRAFTKQNYTDIDHQQNNNDN